MLRVTGVRLLHLGADLLGERLEGLALGQALDQLGGEGGDLLAPLLLDGTGLDLGLAPSSKGFCFSGVTASTSIQA